MSNPERLVVTGRGIQEEICVTPYAQNNDAPRVVATPQPRDIAQALSFASDEWFQQFMNEFRKRGWERAMAMRAAPDVRVTGPAYCKRCGAGPCTVRISTGRCVGCENLTAELAGSYCDPGFGVNPADSAQLLELRQAIDAIGWRGHADEERGNYLERLKQIREEMAQGDLLATKNMRLQKQVLHQRAELRRFNREARARREGALVAHADYLAHGPVNRWRSCLEDLETKERVGSATPADMRRIANLKQWLGDT